MVINNGWMHPNDQLSVNRSEGRKEKKISRKSEFGKYWKDLSVHPPGPVTALLLPAQCEGITLWNQLCMAQGDHTRTERLVNSFCEGKSHQADLAVQCATITGTLGPALAVSLSHNVFTPTFNPLKALGALIDGGKHYQRVYHWPHTSGQNGYEDTKGCVSLREGQAERLGCDFS